MRKLLIIHNPTAGPKSKARLERVLMALGAEAVSVELYPTQSAGDATRYLQKTSLDPDIVVVAAGGDGTINEVLNGLIGKSNPMGIIPLGTANVMAKNMQLNESAASVAKTLARGSLKPFYPGAVVDESGKRSRFGQLIGVGLDAQSVDRVDLKVKRKYGKLAYVLSMLQQLPNALRNCWQLQVEDSTDRQLSNAVILSLGKYYGGKFVIAEQGDWQKPCIHMLSFKHYTSSVQAFLMQLLWMIALPLRIIEYMPGVETRDIQKVYIKELNLDYTAAPVQGDGDIVARLPVTVEIEQTPVMLVCP